MSGRLSQLNDLENRVFDEYVAIMDDEEPETLYTSNGEFDNRRWLEEEAAEICDERERIESVARLDGGTVDVEN